MIDIRKFQFNEDGFVKIRKYQYGENWPIVYISENNKEAYIGETINLYARSKQHYKNPDRRRLDSVHVLADEEFNKSATLDIESLLIQYMAADGKFILQNGNDGLKNHNYYDREKYEAKFELAWNSLKENGLVNHTLLDLKNSDLFKYSPYKALTGEQVDISNQIIEDLLKNDINSFIVNGKPGTGKTILATYLLKYLKDHKKTKNLEIAIIIPMSPLRQTIKNIFKKIKGLNAGMVIGPNNVVKKDYDIVIIDEAHRLQRRKNITNYAAFDSINKKLGLNKDSNQLDWIIKTTKHQILFYDSNQSIRPSDIRPEDFKSIKTKYYNLERQMRVNGGEEYIHFIEDIFSFKKPEKNIFSNYDFKIYDDIENMVNDIKQRNKKYGLSRIVAGYAWPWNTNPKRNNNDINHDIEIDGLKLIWNSNSKDWINSPNAINEVGCIHTVQGYDLNYTGVIIGPEFSYDKKEEKFKVNKKKYFDVNGHRGVHSAAELERYIINIYKTLCTRGIRGTYLYIVDKNLREYFRSLFY